MRFDLDTDFRNINNSILDSFHPNTSRIYNFFLGSASNFSIDAKTAEQIENIMPAVPIIARLNRAFYCKAIKNAMEKGFTQILDFGSSFLIDNYSHNSVPDKVKVVYSDIDPFFTLRYKDLVKENHMVMYEFCDAAKPETLVKSDGVIKHFNNDHKAAIGFNGICWFLSDEQISHAMKVLYEWADEGSLLFLTDFDIENISEEISEVIRIFEQIGNSIYLRSKKKLIELVKPWKIEEPGFLPVIEWINLFPKVEENLKKMDNICLFGGYLIK